MPDNYYFGNKNLTESKHIRFPFSEQYIRSDLHSVYLSWLNSIQCNIGSVDCYWRLIRGYIVGDRISCLQWITRLFR